MAEDKSKEETLLEQAYQALYDLQERDKSFLTYGEAKRQVKEFTGSGVESGDIFRMLENLKLIAMDPVKERIFVLTDKRKIGDKTLKDLLEDGKAKGNCFLHADENLVYRVECLGTRCYGIGNPAVASMGITHQDAKTRERKEIHVALADYLADKQYFPEINFIQIE